MKARDEAVTTWRSWWPALLLALLAGCGAASDPESTISTSVIRSATSEGPSEPEPAADEPNTAAATTETAADADDLVPIPGFDTGVLTVASAGTVIDDFPVLVASTVEQRQRGLMEVTDLGGYAGMVFVFEQDTQTGFWMMNTRIPLTVAFIDSAGRLVSTADMEPCIVDAEDCPSYGPAGPYRWAIEVPLGFLPDLGIDDTVTASFRVD